MAKPQVKSLLKKRSDEGAFPTPSLAVSKPSYNRSTRRFLENFFPNCKPDVHSPKKLGVPRGDKSDLPQESGAQEVASSMSLKEVACPSFPRAGKSDVPQEMVHQSMFLKGQGVLLKVAMKKLKLFCKDCCLSFVL